MIRIEANEHEHTMQDVLQLSQLVLNKPATKVTIKYKLRSGDVLSIWLEITAQGKYVQEILAL